MKSKNYFIICAFSISNLVFLGKAGAQSLITPKFNEVMTKGLENIFNLQKKENLGDQYWKGEWGSEMMNVKFVIALGPKNKSAYDSNCFTTALIHNELAKYAFRNDQLDSKMANSLNEAAQNLLTYKSELDTFNFWHKLPMTEKIKNKAKEKYKNDLVSRPNHYPLNNTFAAVRSNIADDADDTAVAYSAFYLNDLLHQKYPDLISKSSWTPVEIEKTFNAYRDQNRTQSNPFNTLGGTKKNTGAFLTWLTEENSTFMGSVFKGWDDRLRIPEGANNVDCVVNSNVLQMLSHYGRQNTESAQAACRFIEKSIDNGIVKKCGFYYPNPYHLHFAVSQAYEAGASCLQNSAQKLYQDLKESQNENGSWGYTKLPRGIKNQVVNEPISTSIYAANAFFTFINLLDKSSSEMEQAGQAAQFILDSAQLKEDGTYFWKPGIFFSGGTFVRRLVIWKSEAYTSMLAVQALNRYQHLNKSQIGEQK